MIANPLPIEAPPEVREVMGWIGRTEDIRFSPNNRRLALNDFLEQRIYVFAVRLDFLAPRPRITATGCAILSSKDLQYPHGLCFLDDSHLVIANRKGDVSVLQLPGGGSEVLEYDLKPLYTISSKNFLGTTTRSPGSVDCYKLGPHRYRLLVCNNYQHTVTSHRLDMGSSVRARNDGVFLERGLQIPDGISISPDRKWIAVSNHVWGEALIYRNNEDTNSQTGAAVALKGMVCPHGIRFSPDGNRLFVADAATPYLHFFETAAQWDAEHGPPKSVHMMDDRAFYFGRYDSREGGIKGIDIDATGRILVTTCRHQALAFYEVGELLDKATIADPDDIAELSSERDESLRRQRHHVLPQGRKMHSGAKRALQQKRRNMLLQLRRVRRNAVMRHLRLTNKYSRASIIDPSGPVLSMTTHGDRVETVFAAIESIARGSVRPSRIILWLDAKDTYENPPAALNRLRRRGLDIRFSEDFGPHTKYFPYIEQQSKFESPLVTADDDILYPRDWLLRLMAAHSSNPCVIHAFRVRRIQMNRWGFRPYTEWDLANSTRPSHLGFITGVSGVIYPPQFLYVLKEQGHTFIQCCPKADDIWLTVNALRTGFKIAQVDEVPALFPMIPKSQQDRLFSTNVIKGENHRQLLNTFSGHDIAKLRACLSGDCEAQPDLPNQNAV